MGRSRGRSPDAPTKAQLGHQARSLEHADGASLSDVDHDPSGDRGTQHEGDDAIITS
jgi:hypothetical protein